MAYPLGLKGVVVRQGDTYEEALSDVKSAIRFYIEAFGEEVFDVESLILEIFVAETGIERTICTQAKISRDEFLEAYKKT